MSWLSDVFQKGGPFFIVNTFFLAVVIGLIVERAIYFLGRGHLNAKAFLEQLRKLLLGEQRRSREEAVRRDHRAGRARREGRPQPPPSRRGRRRAGDGRDDDRHAARGEDPHRRAVVAREHLHADRPPRHHHRPHPHVRVDRRREPGGAPATSCRAASRKPCTTRRSASSIALAVHARPPAAVGRDEEGRRPTSRRSACGSRTCSPTAAPARREPRAAPRRPRTSSKRVRWSSPHSGFARRRAPRSGGARMQIEQEEIESGELNLIPYLDMVTNLMLFLLASISAGIIFTQIDTHAARQGAAVDVQATQPTQQNPDEQPLKLVVSITRDRVDPVVDHGPRGHARPRRRRSFPRTGQRRRRRATATTCARANNCDGDTQQLRPPSQRRRRSRSSTTARSTNALFEIANRRYTGKHRKHDTYQSILHGRRPDPVQHDRVGDGGDALQAARLRQGADGLRAADRRRRPEEGARIRSRRTRTLYDTSRAPYDPKKMALFQRHLVLVGVRVRLMGFTQREARTHHPQGGRARPRGRGDPPPQHHADDGHDDDPPRRLHLPDGDERARDDRRHGPAAAHRDRRAAAREDVDARHHADRHRRRRQDRSSRCATATSTRPKKRAARSA